MRAAERKIIDQCLALTAMENLSLYADFVEESPEWAVLSASALRIQARRGELDEALIPILFLCLTQAPDLGATVHLAKALAAFGRDGQMASAEIVRRAEGIHVTDDSYFWILDSLLFVLGYLGGAPAADFLSRLEKESPARVNLSDSVYQGKLSAEERSQIHLVTKQKVDAMLRLSDAGTWVEKVTDLKIVDDEAPKAKPLAPWMTR